MDPDALQDEVDEWVKDGIITEAQAEAILARYETGVIRRSRIVMALSIVGSALILAGMLLFLATNWEELPRAARTVVLVGGPALAYAGGIIAYQRDVARIGHALCVLGAVLVGPSIFLFNDLYMLGMATEWRLFVWTVFALPTGHALGSRVGTALGIVLIIGLVVNLSEPVDPAPAVGLLGIALFGLGHRPQGAAVAWTYRVGGVVATGGALLVLTLLEGQFMFFDIGPTAVLAGAGGGAVAATVWLGYARRFSAATWSGVALIALTLATVAGLAAADPVPELLAFGVLHLASLAGLFVTGYYGYQRQARVFIDLATVWGLLQTLSFVEATIIDALSGSIALVIAGLILLGAGVALERGRRSLLNRL